MTDKMTDVTLFIFDLETTGVEPLTDQIVELGACYWRGGERISPRYAMKVKPSCDIAPEAQAVHGISAEMVASCPTFKEVGAKVARHFSGEALGDGVPVPCGYNALAFDLPMINAEFARHGLPHRVDPDTLVDPYIFISWHLRHLPKRNLTAMAALAGFSLVEAHSAAADTEATGHVVAHLVKTGVMPATLSDVLAEQARIRPILAKEFDKFRYHLYPDRQSGELMVGFGKYVGTPLSDADSGYLEFCLDNFDGLSERVRSEFSKVIKKTGK